MMTRGYFRGRITRLAPLTILGLMAATDLAAQGSVGRKRFLDGDLVIRDQGSFYIGGVPKTTYYASTDTASTNPNDIIIGQMYVQFQIPGARHSKHY